MEDRREKLGSLSDKFKTNFIRVFTSKTPCDLLNPLENNDPNDVPLLLHHPRKTLTITRKNINYRDSDGNTLLHLAVMNFNAKHSHNQLAIIRALKNANKEIDINVQNNESYTPLDIAAGMVPLNLDLIDALITPVQGEINKPWTRQDNIDLMLREATLENRVHTLKYLLKLDARPDAQNAEGKSALHLALENPKTDRKIIRLLERKMKDDHFLGDKFMKGANLLHIVVQRGMPGLVKHLVKFIDVNSKMQNGLTALALAIDKPLIAKELIKAGAIRWTAYEKSKPSKKEFTGITTLVDDIKQNNSNIDFKLSMQGKSAEVQNAVFNLMAYAVKLERELNSGSTANHLQEKYDELKNVITNLLTENDPDNMKTILENALKNNTLTQNRSKIFGFYWLHGFHAKKRNTIDQNHKHFVKSTTEELLYDLKKAVDNSPKPQVIEESTELEESELPKQHSRD